MATCNNEYFLGQGKVYVADRSGGAISGPWKELGDTSSFEISNDMQFAEVYESCSGQRKRARRVVTQTNVTLNIDTYSFSKETFAKAVFGDASVAAATPVVDEAIPQAICQLNSPLFPSGVGPYTAVTVKQGSTSLTLNTDYTLDSNGVPTLVSATNLTGPAPYANIKISYTPSAGEVINAMTQVQKEYAFKLDGINTAEGGKNVVVDVYNVVLDLADTIALINDDFASLALTGNVQADTAHTELYKIKKKS